MYKNYRGEIMKQTVCYLYEYQNNTQVRNVGFAKCHMENEKATFQIHGKGIPCNDGEELDLYLFQAKEELCYISQAGKVQAGQNKINYIVTVEGFSEEQFAMYDGFYMQRAGEKQYVAMWNNKKVNFNKVEKFMVTQKEPEVVELDEKTEVCLNDYFHEEEAQAIMREEHHEIEAEECCYEVVRRQQEKQRKEEQSHQHHSDSSHEDRGGSLSDRAQEYCSCQEEQHCSGHHEEESCSCQDRYTYHGNSRKNNESRERNYGSQGREEHREQNQEYQEKEEYRERVQEHEEKRKITYEKIHRQDIAKLPQREWKLANNSFLLHGYHNYQHILFVQEAGRSFIGVPGVYSPREEDAAKNFGFPVFHRVNEGEISLNSSEYEVDQDFGYWCKEVSYRSNRY